MKNIIKIFQDDLKDMFSNVSVLILLIGLAILPSLYAWFNIKASWDPYGNTSNIAVAVVNNDEGTTLFDKDLNMGDRLIKQLKENKALGWKFVDSKEAKTGVETGKYYASIEITKDFSKNLVSILDKDIKKAKIVYTVNEKINAIAPKITDKGASTIQQQVNQTVVKTASEAVFEIMNEAGITLEDKLPTLTKIEGALIEVQGKFTKIEDILNTASDASEKMTDVVKVLQANMPKIESTLKSSESLSSDVKEFLKSTKSSMNDIAPTIKNDLQIINDLSVSIAGGVKNLINAIEENYEKAPEIVDNLYDKVNNLSNISSTLGNFLTKLSNIAPGTALEDTINKINATTEKLESAKDVLGSIKNQLANGQTPSVDKLNSVIEVLNDVNGITGNLLNNFDSKIVSQLNNIFDKGVNVSNNVIDLLNTAEGKLPQVKDLLSTALNFSGDADEAIAYIRKKMPEAKSALDGLVSALSKVNNSKDMDELISFLKNDVVTESNFIKEPVELVSKSLYPMANYGAGMTPFYTVLSLWVGILLLTSLVTTEVHGDYKPYEVYFGRGLTFLMITLLQGFIVSAGDILVLGVKTTNPILFLC